VEIQSLGVSLQNFAYPSPGNAAASTSKASSTAGASATPATSASTADTTLSTDTPVSSSQLLQAIQQLNYLVGAGHDLDFNVSIDANHQTVVSVTDARSGALIQQLPPAQALAIASSQTTQPGMLITQHA